MLLSCKFHALGRKRCSKSFDSSNGNNEQDTTTGLFHGAGDFMNESDSLFKSFLCPDH